MTGHLAALIPGQGLDQACGHVRHRADQCVAGGGSVAATGGQGDGYGLAAGALD